MTVLSRLCGGLQGRTSNSFSNIWKTSLRGFKKDRTPKTENLKHREFKQPEKPLKMEESIKPEVSFLTPNHHMMHKNLLKCSIFATGFCCATFAGVSIWQYERARSVSQRPLSNIIKAQWNTMNGWQTKEGEYRQMINRWWNDQSDGQKVFWPICFLNTLVFLCFRHPALKMTMLKYFAFSPAGHAVCWPMLLSTFSHYSIFHLAANMYVLHSFSIPVGHKLGQEQFLGLYLGCGVLASLGSAAFKILTRSLTPSIGASGAILGVLGFSCTMYPDSRLGIIFIPNFHFSAEHGLWALMLFDTLGIMLRFRLFDHAGHLSGALVGIAYAKWGNYLWEKREIGLKKWHSLRQSIEGTDSKP